MTETNANDPTRAATQSLADDLAPARGTGTTEPHGEAEGDEEVPDVVRYAAHSAAWPGLPAGMDAGEARRRSDAAAVVAYRSGVRHGAARYRAELDRLRAQLGGARAAREHLKGLLAEDRGHLRLARNDCAATHAALRDEYAAHQATRDRAAEAYRGLESAYIRGANERDAEAERAIAATDRADKAEALVEHYRHRGEMTPSERQSILGETVEQSRQPEAGWIALATRHVADTLVDNGSYGWWIEQAAQHGLGSTAVPEIAQALAAALQEQGRPFDARTLAELRATAGEG